MDATASFVGIGPRAGRGRGKTRWSCHLGSRWYCRHQHARLPLLRVDNSKLVFLQQQLFAATAKARGQKLPGSFRHSRESGNPVSLLVIKGAEPRAIAHPCAARGEDSCPHFNSTLAPAASRSFLNFSASSLLTPSLTVCGAPSTRSLASLRPRPVIARTALITSTFFSPAAASTTVNSVFSSAAAAPPPAAGAAATATGAAADTPNFSSIALTSSITSTRVLDEIASMICSLLRDMLVDS